ncbi:inositol-tetrakisphosphate 1-kinase-like isoform X1 [Zerene cesonia]|uniref:inositol-tetrakisphosphate 1-kinase-like isoform X1 n=2 Tax=Zerene cesonia TaxID=33412 RepID=UPI0018E5563C|nr:inositol-tetrakisphosphate 1-kinase-like isoform X1 [Zerene cesonia]XP_038212622.1 inositol-tetrakisphosphate 1-kinase-like isoform X1 [Zerene cesonia]XP_038212623.1 inositol-tetrakisphosphate 1-kinase-like isoform X1 [Zerene cesonia]
MNENCGFYKTIGIWMSEKKSHKLNWKELLNACTTHGYKLVKLDLEKPLEDQGEMDVFLHKLTDIIAAADQGDPKASSIIGRVEQYLSNHPNITVIDPLNNVRILLNRYGYYTILEDEVSLQNIGVFTPTFAEFTTANIEQNIEIMRQRGVTFPVICKPTLAHGSKSAHEMVLIFNERGLNVCKPPCVVQSFVNHNAVLHKVFLVGNRYHICQRPSLKNFYASDDIDPIFYSTGEVCKADSQSTLSILDPHDKPDVTMHPNEDKIKSIIKVLRKRIGLLLAGFDVVIDNVSGNHAVIDINVFPSYDNFPNFFNHLLDCIQDNVRILNGDSSYDDCVNNHRPNGLINIGVSSVQYGVTGMNIN